MQIFLQIPMSDLRGFQSHTPSRLALPMWPSPTPYREFVRGFGQVRTRAQGGVSGWINESEICDAKNALIFVNDEMLEKIWLKYRVAPRSRHVYFDGHAVTKLEVVFSSRRDTGAKFSVNKLSDLIETILQLRVIVRTPYSNDRKVTLESVGKHLAISYLYATTSTSEYSNIGSNATPSIFPGQQLITVQTAPNERVSTPRKAKLAVESVEYGLILHQWRMRGATRVWLLQQSSSKSHATQKTRWLRIYLGRLQTEIECLRLVLKAIATEVIFPSSGTPESARLQEYLNEATRRIIGIDKKTGKKFDTTLIGELARSSLEQVSPGQRDGLIAKLEQLNIRPNVMDKVVYQINNLTIEEVIMGDKQGDTYNVEQAGAVGPNAHAHDIHFHKGAKDTIDYDALIAELAMLREKMKELAAETDSDRDLEIGAIAAAEAAARADEPEGVLASLAKAGKWTLEIAEKIGVSLATEFLKKAMIP